MEVDSVDEVLLVAETPGGVFDPLDLGIQGFALSIRDAMAEISEDVIQPCLQHAGDRNDRLQPGAAGPAVPAPEKVAGGLLIAISEQDQRSLFQGPSPGRLQRVLRSAAKLFQA